MMLREVLRKARKLAKIARRPALLTPLRHGSAAAVEHEVSLSLIKPATIVDVGANVGQFSLIASAIHPQAQIFGFEPLPRAADVYEKVFAGRSNVTLFRHALGERAGTATLNLAGADDSSSLLPISDAMVSLYPQTRTVGKISVNVRPLRDVLPEIVAPALLKIDVQGAELEVLKGCGEMLAAFDHIYVELSFTELYLGQPLASEVICYLAGRQFTVCGVYNVSTVAGGASVQADFLFQRQP